MQNDQKRANTSIKKTILVVEDDEDMSEVIYLTLLEEPMYNAVVVHNSTEALEAVPTLKPDLMIIDYLLSGITGIELYDKLHAMETLRKTPTIITSASLYVYKQQLDERNLTGLEKPFDLDVLLETIKQILN